MPTSNSRNITVKTREMLWGRAASRCAFPDCRRELVIDGKATDNASLFGEACHMVAKEPEGPRGDSPLTSKQRDEYDNLLLLCNVHHKIIDDQPNTYPVERLKAMKAEHEQWVRESLQGKAPLWSVPYQRNGLFTGREDLLNILHDRLTTTKTTALTQPQAISGLGGIDKTQIALEYAYSYRDSYQAVFWVRAATLDALVLDYVAIAGLLRLPERDEKTRTSSCLPSNAGLPKIRTGYSFWTTPMIWSACATFCLVCAFLDPDAIPEEMLIEGISHLGPSLASTITDSF